MSAMAVNVTTALSRAAYGGMEETLAFLETLTHDDLLLTALGLAVVSDAYLQTLANRSSDDAEAVRARWLAQLTDTARASP